MRYESDFAPVIRNESTSITSLFREMSSYNSIIKSIYPLFPGDSINVASIGCSTGEEVYSLLMLSLESKPNIKISGYDFNENNIEKAKKGIYPLTKSNSNYVDLMKNNGVIFDQAPKFRTQLVMPDNLKKSIDFKTHDITKKPLSEKYPIILCANLLPYFLGLGENFNLKVLDNIANSLTPNGYLITEGDRYRMDPNVDPRYEEYLRYLKISPFFKLRKDLAKPFRKDPESLTEFPHIFQAV